MRNNFLSFLIACGVAVSVSIFYHNFSRGGDGIALAAIDTGDTIKPRYSKNLRRSVSYNPENLLEMTGQDIRATLHEPGLIRRDAPTIVWQYRSEACVLDLYFNTSEKDAGHAKVMHYEMRERGISHEKGNQGQCIKDVINAHNNPRMADVSSFYKSP